MHLRTTGQSVLISLCIGVVCGIFAPPSSPGVAANHVSIPEDFAGNPMSYYFAERYREALQYGETLAGDPSAPDDARSEANLAIATIHLAQKQQSKARQAILRVLADNPSADLSDPERYPTPLTRLFYKMRDSVCTAQIETLVAKKKLLPEVTTIAIGDIENNSIVTSKYNLDNLCRGLAHVLAHDIRGATSLKVVDRQRLSVLLQEIGLSKETGTVDPQTRVRAGRLSGAQSFLFGQFMQLDEKNARMDLRWIDTSTGEQLLSDAVTAKIESAEDIFKMERQLLLEVIAPRIEKLLNAPAGSKDLQRKIEQLLDQRRNAMPKRNSYASWIEATGRARAKEDAGDMVAAIAAWNEAHALNPADSTASLRAKTSSAYRNAQSSKG